MWSMFQHVRRVKPDGRIGLHELLVTRSANHGVTGLWPHQYEAADLAHRGRNVIISTGHGLGKSLAYLTPALASCLDGGTVLYLTPTKALAADQLRCLRELRITQVRAACFDGDTPFEERAWVRKHANYVLTNPDMLHRGILPRHAQWSLLLPARCATSSSTSATATAACSAPTSPRSCAVCAASAPATAPTRLPARLGHRQRARTFARPPDRPWMAEVADDASPGVRRPSPSGSRP